jgi:hypothetical protein
VRFGFFRGPELDVGGAGYVGVVVVDAAQFLAEVVREQPNFRAVITNEVGEDELNDGLMDGKSDFGVEAGGDLVQAFPDTEADGFEVGGFGGADVEGDTAVEALVDSSDGAAQVRKFMVQAAEDDLGTRRKPIDSAEQNADAKAVYLNRDGRVGLGFDGIFDSGDDDGVFNYGDDDAACGEIGDNFFGRRRGGFLSAEGGGGNC